MKKNLEKLVEKFKKIETELVEILNESSIKINELDDKQVVKKAIKDYIKKVGKAKKLFDEYETIAKEIEDINNDEGESAELSKAVLEFRESEMGEVLAQGYGTESDVLLEKLKKKEKVKKSEKESAKEK
ncbi:MAG: hypothetical protein IKD36_01245 [Clostridia bacterium]|nr:hypothetical protein [Clostridia bacterium]